MEQDRNTLFGYEGSQTEPESTQQQVRNGAYTKSPKTKNHSTATKRWTDTPEGNFQTDPRDVTEGKRRDGIRPNPDPQEMNTPTRGKDLYYLDVSLTKQHAMPADQNPSHTLHVGNLPTQTSDDELKALFCRQRGYKRMLFFANLQGPTCFVEFEDIPCTIKALTGLDGHMLSCSTEGGLRLSLCANSPIIRSSLTAAESVQESARQACLVLVTELYQNCDQAMRTVTRSIRATLSSKSNDSSDEGLRLVQNEADRLRIWGDGFDASDGGLEQILEGLEEMQETVATFLVGIARRLSRHVAELAGPKVTLQALLTSIEKAESRFPDASLMRLRVLAGLNWLRHQRFRKMRDSDHDRNRFSRAQTSAKVKWLGTRKRNRAQKEMEKHDISLSASHAKNSEYKTVTRQSSTDDDIRRAASTSSFGTSTNPEEVGRTKFPPTPVTLNTATQPFQCPICYQLLTHVKSKLEWRKHVIQDIQPYSCSFPKCHTSTTTYGSRRAWMDHEFSYHRFTAEWICVTGCGLVFQDEASFHDHICTTHQIGDSVVREVSDKCRHQKPLPKSQKITCLLCHGEIYASRTSLQRHIGRHLEEIALAALPPAIYYSHGEDDFYENSRALGLEVVSSFRRDISHQHSLSMAPPELWVQTQNDILSDPLSDRQFTPPFLFKDGCESFLRHLHSLSIVPGLYWQDSKLSRQLDEVVLFLCRIHHPGDEEEIASSFGKVETTGEKVVFLLDCISVDNGDSVRDWMAGGRYSITDAYISLSDPSTTTRTYGVSRTQPVSNSRSPVLVYGPSMSHAVIHNTDTSKRGALGEQQQEEDFSRSTKTWELFARKPAGILHTGKWFKKTTHPGPRTEYICQVCRSPFRQQEHVENHLLRQHNCLVSSEVSSNPLEASISARADQQPLTCSPPPPSFSPYPDFLGCPPEQSGGAGEYGTTP